MNVKCLLGLVSDLSTDLTVEVWGGRIVVESPLSSIQKQNLTSWEVRTTYIVLLILSTLTFLLKKRKEKLLNPGTCLDLLSGQ